MFLPTMRSSHLGNNFHKEVAFYGNNQSDLLPILDKYAMQAPLALGRRCKNTENQHYSLIGSFFESPAIQGERQYQTDMTQVNLRIRITCAKRENDES